MELPDHDLLNRFAESRDDAAFRLLVERHLPMVHGVARRVTASEDLAKDVAQTAFMRLAQRAALVPENVLLSAWLHRVTQHLAIDLVRSEERRKKRELATLHPAAMNSSPSPDWSAMAPLVDSLVNRLPAADREVLLLRYYRDEPHAAVARQLGVSETVVKKRASRALEKLRILLAKQGIATTAAALATLLPAHAATPVSCSLARSISTASQGIVPLAPQGINLHLAMTTVQKSAIAGAAIIFMSSMGYALRSSPENQGPADGEIPRAAGGSGDSPSARSRNERRSTASAAERLERLRAILAITSRIEQPRQMLAFIAELAPDQFAETAAQLRELGVETDSNNFRLLLSAWTKRHPLGAAGWALQNPAAGLPATIFKTWGENDPAAAIDWITRNLPGATGSDAKEREPLLQVLASMVPKDPAAAVKALEVIPAGNDRIAAIKALTLRLGMDDLERLIAAVTDAPQRSAVIAAGLPTFDDYGRTEQAFELLLTDKEARQLADLESFFASWHHSGEEEAIAAIDKLPEAKAREQAKAGILTKLGTVFEEGAITFLDQHPDWVSDPLMLLVADRCGVKLGAELSLRIQDPGLRDTSLTRHLKAWLGTRAAPAARKWMEQHEIPPNVREALESPPPSDP